MAFLAASPISTMKPIWVSMLLSSPMRFTPVMAASKHIGTIRITASGRVTLSYSAASSRKAKITAMTKAMEPALPAVVCW